MLTLALWPLRHARSLPPPSVTEVPLNGSKLFLFTFKWILLSFTSKRPPSSLSPSLHPPPCCSPYSPTSAFFPLAPSFPPLSPFLFNFSLYLLSWNLQSLSHSLYMEPLKYVTRDIEMLHVRTSLKHVQTCLMQVSSVMVCTPENTVHMWERLTSSPLKWQNNRDLSFVSVFWLWNNNIWASQATSW